MGKLFYIIIISILIVSRTNVSAQIEIAVVPAQHLVEEVLAGGGVEIFNVTYQGDSAQFGLFSSGNSVYLGMDYGMVITTGNLINQNDESGPDYIGSPADASNISSSDDNGIQNDPDLNQILDELGAMPLTNNVAIIEFDFIPSGDSLSINYSFASEEYNGYVCSEFIDVFGFFISGPGLNGPFANQAQNIALMPGTQHPVCVNTVNNGISDGDSLCPPGGLINQAYYVDNSFSLNFGPYAYTRILSAQANVICGATYHMKLIIANGFDNNFDSWVFLQAESFSSNLPNIQVASLLPNSYAVEGCAMSDLTFIRSDSEFELALPITYAGTATPGVDYESLPDTIVFAAGQNSISISLVPILDDLEEANESIILNYRSVNGCGDTVLLNYTIYISDPYEPIEVDTVVVTCNEFTWHGTTYSTSGSPTYTLINKEGCDSVITTLHLTINAVSDLGISLDGLTITSNNNNAIYQWLDCEDSYSAITSATSQFFTTSGSGSYAVEVTENGCVDTSECVVITSIDFEEYKLLDAINVYPNPTKGSFLIEFNHTQELLNIRLIDYLGRVVETLQVANTNNIQMNIEGKPGIYFLEMTNRNGKKVTVRLEKN